VYFVPGVAGPSPTVTKKVDGVFVRFVRHFSRTLINSSSMGHHFCCKVDMDTTSPSSFLESFMMYCSPYGWVKGSKGCLVFSTTSDAGKAGPRRLRRQKVGLYKLH
jgi:hypothetical protein